MQKMKVKKLKSKVKNFFGRFTFCILVRGLPIAYCLLLTAYCLLPTSYCFAGGFQINLQGQKQTGMGHTGTGLLLDGAPLFFNPGANWRKFYYSSHTIS
jgi:hypothetical protein